MFQRMILRQGQAARSAALSLTSTPMALRQTSRMQPRIAQGIRVAAVPQHGRRLYSTENNSAAGEQPKEAAKEEAAAGENGEELLRKELEGKQKEIVELKDKYRRSVADFLNLQERTKREMDNARNFAIQRFAVDLLESIDNFDRALLAVPAEKLSAEASQEVQDLVSGLQMTQNILMGTLKKHGLEQFDASLPAEGGKPQKFDPNMHEATFMSKNEALEDGDIMYAQTKGFKLHGRVLRAAKVGVVKNA
ncbi:hypothetical protein ASPZODRAFT_151722 [Penicilliopsis zonata CBS 506.65]|uniref:GrpE protein homolog n=1 Tax=Penicilliopsis zonata CBS 506.65 TaxID=1073090 RepID=A0A1L9SIX7_9EURO|nr:hypothetical protein ASPZODRAFT_151722 [Penicilliopsis zonata CBS 506.65]OJJ47180.1 hypothetical protein ASPZODRAFT_151722 [Penicilliopsis zonata CBS 506.65]